MWWKIYFWITIGIILLGLIGLSVTPKQFLFMSLVYMFLVIVSVIGLYSFVFRKDVFRTSFWKYFLGIVILSELLHGISIVFPNLELLSFLRTAEDGRSSINLTILGYGVLLPLYYAIFKLARGEKRAENKRKNKQSWGTFHILLWGYSTIFMGMLTLFYLLPSGTYSVNESILDIVYGVVPFIPICIFWAIVVFQHKQYNLNWWKTALIATSVMYTLLIFFSIFDQSPYEPSNFDILGIIPLVVMLISLIIIGREQLDRIGVR